MADEYRRLIRLMFSRDNILADFNVPKVSDLTGHPVVLRVE